MKKKQTTKIATFQLVYKLCWTQTFYPTCQCFAILFPARVLITHVFILPAPKIINGIAMNCNILISNIFIFSEANVFRIHVDELVQERRNSTANALELRLSCTNPLICCLLSRRSALVPKFVLSIATRPVCFPHRQKLYPVSFLSCVHNVYWKSVRLQTK